MPISQNHWGWRNATFFPWCFRICMVIYGHKQEIQKTNTKHGTKNKTFPWWCWGKPICSKGWFRLFKINPVTGIKDFGPTCRKTHNEDFTFCPRATAEGMVESESAVHRRVPNPETEEKRLWFCGVSCATANASEILRKPLKPKGRGRQKEVSPQDEQGCEFWALSKR